MGRTRLPAHIRKLIPEEHRERRKPKLPGRTVPGWLKDRSLDSELEAVFLNRLEHAGLPPGEPQFRFVPGRQHRFDRAWPEHMVAVEVMGGVWSDDGHGRKSMVVKDYLKLSLAAALGWRCLPLTREMIEDGTAVNLLASALGLTAREVI